MRKLDFKLNYFRVIFTFSETSIRNMRVGRAMAASAAVAMTTISRTICAQSSYLPSISCESHKRRLIERLGTCICVRGVRCVRFAQAVPMWRWHSFEHHQTEQHRSKFNFVYHSQIINQHVRYSKINLQNTHTNLSLNIKRRLTKEYKRSPSKVFEMLFWTVQQKYTHTHRAPDTFD